MKRVPLSLSLCVTFHLISCIIFNVIFCDLHKRVGAKREESTISETTESSTVVGLKSNEDIQITQMRKNKVANMESKAIVSPLTTETMDIIQVPTAYFMPSADLIKTVTNSLPLPTIKVEQNENAPQDQQTTAFSSWYETADMDDSVDIVAQEQKNPMFSQSTASEVIGPQEQ